MRKRFALALAFLLLSLTINASAKSYTLDKAEVYYKILPNGLVEATEEITFDFSGSFSFAFASASGTSGGGGFEGGGGGGGTG